MRFRAGGHLAALLGLAVLTGCNQIYGLDETRLADKFVTGGTPKNYAVLCDIESRHTPRRCATAEEIAADEIVPNTNAAVALTIRRTGTGNTSLDYSAEAIGRCGGPEVVTYLGAYPEGSAVCVKYFDVIGPGLPYANANNLCAAWCEDLQADSGGEAEVKSFCTNHARASTSVALRDEDLGIFGLGGYLGACTAEGVLQPEFDTDGPLIDPRRVSDRLMWDPLTLVGTAIVPDSGSIFRTAATTGVADAGATAATQLIKSGDGYIEFTASETNTRRIIGLAVGSVANPAAALGHIDFGIDLRADGTLRIIELGTVKASLGAYSAGQTFRINVRDNHDGSAAITYSRLIASCNPGTPCPEELLYTHVGAPAGYPLHVDSALVTQGATLTNVRIVRIKGEE